MSNSCYGSKVKFILQNRFIRRCMILGATLCVMLSGFAYANSVSLSTSWYIVGGVGYSINVNFHCDDYTYTNDTQGYKSIICAVHLKNPSEGWDCITGFTSCPNGLSPPHSYSSGMVWNPGQTRTYANHTYNGQFIVHYSYSYLDDPDWYANLQICASTILVDSDKSGLVSTSSYDILSESCSLPPPPPDAVVCTATSFTINYGNIGPAAFNGNTKSGTGSISCTGGSASVKISFSSPTISLSNGGKANLTFSNGSTSSTISVAENATSSFTVNSRLSSSSTVKTGAFSGSTTIITDLQ